MDRIGDLLTPFSCMGIQASLIAGGGGGGGGSEDDRGIEHDASGNSIRPRREIVTKTEPPWDCRVLAF